MGVETSSLRASPLPGAATSSWVNGAPGAVSKGETPGATHAWRARLRQSSLADAVFGAVLLGCALSLFAILLLVFAALLHGSHRAFAAFGFDFFTERLWNPVTQRFGVLPFLEGTVVSAAVALLLAAPGALAVAFFALEVCPRSLRPMLGFLTELLAAIPGVVYGLWALLVLVPLMREHVAPFLEQTLGWTGLFGAPSYGVGMLTASVVLAIMIFPVITAVSREVMAAVPRAQTEGMLALGATRWEAVRTGVLRNARLGIAGSLILGLGRALGETMAVAMVIGNHPALLRNLLAPGYSLASVLANEFAEASGDLHLSALSEVGLTLLLVTALVNTLARLLVWLVVRERGSVREVRP